MTDEQIKQNAEEYASKLVERDYHEDIWLDLYDAYTAGAHSRDEEIKEMKDELESLRKGFYERGDKLKELMLANNKLRNPWISVEERLPKTKEDSPSGLIFAMCYDSYDLDDTHGSILCLIPCIFVWMEMAENVFQWEAAMDYPYKVEDISAWMPILKLKKGE